MQETLFQLFLKKQYEYGILAGIELKKIHQIKAPVNALNWEERFNKKIDRKLKMYEECPFKI